MRMGRGMAGSLLGMLALLALWGPTVAEPAVVFVGNRADLGADDSIDWAQLGAAFTSVTDPAAITSTGGITGTVNNPLGDLFRLDQSTGGWSGNFAPGDALLWTVQTTGPIEIELDTPVAGVGAQIQSDAFGGFTGTIRVYDGDDNLLGEYSFPGNSTSDADNTALFLGILSDTEDISRIVFLVEGSLTDPSSDFAINLVSLVTQGSPIGVPGPMTLLLLGVGLLAARLGTRGRP